VPCEAAFLEGPQADLAAAAVAPVTDPPLGGAPVEDAATLAVFACSSSSQVVAVDRDAGYSRQHGGVTDCNSDCCMSAQVTASTQATAQAAESIPAHEQRCSLRQLRSKMNQLSEEAAALRECLDEAGVVRDQAFYARLHRRRFAETRRSHPCKWEASLQHALAAMCPALAVARFAGLPAAQGLCAAARSLAADAAEVLRAATSTARPSALYICGGNDGPEILSSAERFDPEEDRWEPLTPMTRRRRGAAVATIDRCVYVCGGLDGQETPSSAERFDPAVGSWEELPSLTRRRRLAAVAVLYGRLYVCGGADGQETLRSAECFDPVAHDWRSLAPMVWRRHGATAVAMAGCLYVYGGDDGQETLSSVECFDPCAVSGQGDAFPSDSGAWNALPPMAVRRNGAVAGAMAGFLYICGGSDGKETLSSTVRFNPQTSTWEALPSMMRRRRGASIATLMRQLYVCGGLDGQDTIGSAERFDPRTEIWEELASMSRRRRGAAMVAVEGCLYVLGGFEGSKTLRSAERFNPAAGSWEDLPPMWRRQSVASAAGVTVV